LCESGLTILIITRFLLPPRNEERIVLLLSANRPLLGIVARGRRAEIRAGISGKVGDVSGGDNLQSAKTALKTVPSWTWSSLASRGLSVRRQTGMGSGMELLLYSISFCRSMGGATIWAVPDVHEY
jgi:hypothetical protein